MDSRSRNSAVSVSIVMSRRWGRRCIQRASSQWGLHDGPEPPAAGAAAIADKPAHGGRLWSRAELQWIHRSGPSPLPADRLLRAASIRAVLRSRIQKKDVALNYIALDFDCNYNLINMPRSPQTESRTARLTILIDPRKKRIFEEICTAQDLTPSQVVRRLIREYIIEHAAGRALPEWLTVQGKKQESASEQPSSFPKGG